MVGGNGNNIRAYSVLRGGIAIHNPLADPVSPGGAYGTIGLIATSDGADRWIVSCYHVLCRKNADMPAGVNEPVYHPVMQFQPAPVGTVSSDRADRGLDCAAAKVISGMALDSILGVGRLAPAADPILGARVIKSGAESGVTEGIIISFTADEMQVGPVFGAPSDYQLSAGGDSGSLWVDATTYAPVALHYRGSDRGTQARAFAKPIKAIFESLRLKLIE